MIWSSLSSGKSWMISALVRPEAIRLEHHTQRSCALDTRTAEALVCVDLNAFGVVHMSILANLQFFRNLNFKSWACSTTAKFKRSAGLETLHFQF